ncbi:hypothetical protein BKP43_38720 [Variovorax boronicumulans]|nr:hypothetical protein BKP43_38720 [Variovorax boronicumulans]
MNISAGPLEYLVVYALVFLVGMIVGLTSNLRDLFCN